MTLNAKSLRRDATPEERKLWTILREVRPRFTRQLPVGPYILNFACRCTKIGIELDGSQHIDRVEYDDAGTAFSNDAVGTFCASGTVTFGTTLKA